MHLYARITKVDEATGKVYGRAVQEVVDRSGEIFDYETSKPNFEKWSADASEATDGKSVGNLRAMHGKIAAGKLTEISFNDAEKAIDICAEVIDPVEREKCLKGVYTGFSIGGSYVGPKWDDAMNKGVKRYTAQPSEISLVDLPCVPTAQFTVVKSDGAEELRKFETTTDDSDALAKWADGLTDGERASLLAKLAPPEPKSTTGDLSKSATSPEEDTMNDELQKAHDLNKAELAKVSGERDELKKALDTAATEIATRDELLVKAAAALDERNEVIAKFQAAPAPIKAALMSLGKGQDIGRDLPEVEQVKKADGTVDEAATAIKKALMNPIVTR